MKIRFGKMYFQVYFEGKAYLQENEKDKLFNALNDILSMRVCSLGAASVSVEIDAGVPIDAHLLNEISNKLKACFDAN